jgi:hypothetical protein
MTLASSMPFASKGGELSILSIAARSGRRHRAGIRREQPALPDKRRRSMVYVSVSLAVLQRRSGKCSNKCTSSS